MRLIDTHGRFRLCRLERNTGTQNPLTAEEFRVRYDGLMEYAGVKPEVSAAAFDTVHAEKAAVQAMIEDL